MNIKNGWLSGALRVPSPNWDERPPGCGTDLIVIHAISLPACHFGGPHIDALFCNRLDSAAHPGFASIADLRVSAHLLIRRDGALHQYVPLHGRAWHAGRSQFQGRSACNDFSIGIELEGCDELPFEDAQYEQLISVCQTLMRHMPDIRHITGHSDIAPDRKTDPGPHFQWQRLRDRLDFSCRDYFKKL